MRDKEYYIKESTYQEDIAIINTYEHDNRGIKYKENPTELEGEITSSTIIVRDFNNPFSISNR